MYCNTVYLHYPPFPQGAEYVSNLQAQMRETEDELERVKERSTSPK
jgi:hypothetical protein